jgi:putative tricarboxylic transport membrane protein
MFENWMLGLNLILDWQVLTAIVFGVGMGIAVGAMPGLSGPTGIALMIPFTYMLSPIVSIALLVSLYSAAEYGGSITAITINTPGTPSAAITAIDGYQLTQQGKTGHALTISIISSVLGGILGTIILILFSIPLARAAVAFGPIQYFSLGVFGVSIIASLSGGNWVKAIIATLIGLLIKTIGSDHLSGTFRFTLGWPPLWDGVPFVPAMLGLFAITEVFAIIEAGIKTRLAKGAEFSSEWVPWPEMKALWKCLLRSSLIGTGVGVIPGTGAVIGSILSYNEAKRFSRNPDDFGKGSYEGVCASESANNACVGGALVPTLTLGVPGSGSTAVLIGALMLQDIAPGPLLFSRHPDIVYGIFICLFLANIVMLFMGLLGIRFWLKVVQISPAILGPLIFGVAFVGAYSIGGSVGDIIIMIVIGLIGFVMRKFKFPLVPLVIALVLGEIIEISLRRALILSGGSYMVFITDPISLGLLLMAVFSTIFAIVRDFRSKKNTNQK